MSTLLENSSDLPANLELIVKLIHFQEHLFLYSIKSFDLLNELPNLTNSQSFKISQISIKTQDLVQRQQILEKYHDKLGVLTKFSELYQIYNKLNAFTKPILTQLFDEVKQIKSIFEEITIDSEEESTTAKTTDEQIMRNNIKHFMIQYLFPRLIFEKSVLFLLNQDDLSLCEDDDLLTDAKHYDFPDADDLSVQNITTIKPVIKSYVKIYNLNNSKHLYCFYQSLKKELLFDPEFLILTPSDSFILTSPEHPSFPLTESFEAYHAGKLSEIDLKVLIDRWLHGIINVCANMVLPTTQLLMKSLHLRLKYYELSHIDEDKFATNMKYYRSINIKLKEFTKEWYGAITDDVCESVYDELKKLLTIFGKLLTSLLTTNEDTITLQSNKNNEIIAIACKEQFHLIDKLLPFNDQYQAYLEIFKENSFISILQSKQIQTQFQTLYRHLYLASIIIALFMSRFKYENRILDALNLS